MTKATIKLLILLDTKIDYEDEIIEALRLQNEEYRIATGGEIKIEHEIKRQDFSTLEWVEYFKNSYGVSKAFIRQNTSDTDKEFYSVAYVIDDSNWSKEGMNRNIYGWHVGNINGFQIQLIRAVKGKKTNMFIQKNIPFVFIAFYEELMHSWDDVIHRKLNINIDKLFQMDYDEGIVHAAHRDYRRWRYRKTIKRLRPYLLDLFKEDMKINEEQLKKLYLLIFKREPDQDAKGYIDLELDFILDEMLKSREHEYYKSLYVAAKNIEKNL